MFEEQLAEMHRQFDLVAAGRGELRQEMRAGFAMIMKRLDDLGFPGEAADRSIDATLADHEKRITALERTSS
jgi:hypothetical protein